MTESPKLRADARRNRDAVIAAARSAFGDRGLGASLDDIAKCAGVGSGTLYRHFPTRDDLVAAVFSERMAEQVAALEVARREPDPWDAFAGYVTGLCRAQAADKGLSDLFAIGHRGKELRELRARAYGGLVTLIDAAKASGDLREDFTSEDIALLLMANAGVIERTGEAGVVASERFVALSLDGFRVQGATPAPPAPAPRALVAAMRRLAGSATDPAAAPPEMPAQTTARFLNQMPHGLSNVVEVPPGRLVFVTGQMAVDAEGQLVGPGDFATQVEQVFENLAVQLSAVEATFEHVIKIEVLSVVDDFIEHMYVFGETRDRYVNQTTPPASSITLVPKLVHPGALIDIAAIAHLPS